MKMMKNALVVFALAAMTTGFAQKNVNEKEEKVITKTSVTDNTGKTTSIKEVTKEEKNAIAVNKRIDETNFTTYTTPTQVDTNVSYTNEGKTYRFAEEPNGYGLMTSTEDNKAMKYATLRPMSQQGYYFFNVDGVSSISYYNNNGDFVVETYNEETDEVTVTTYFLDKEDRKKMVKKMKANKMTPKK